MANSIDLVTKFLPVMDEVYKEAAKSSILDTANNNVQFVGAKTIKLFKFSANGLSDYSRDNGFTVGALTGTWETLTLSKDRAASFQLDVMDNDESLGQTLAALTGDYIRVYVAPEIDAYRFSKYAEGAGTSVAATLASSTDILEALDTADKVMSDAEVPHDGRVLFISEEGYKLLKGQITRYIENAEGNINRAVEVFDGMRVVRVPSGRFNTAVTLGSNGFTASGVAINFLIVHPSAVAQVVKHVAPRLFAPSQNLDADAWKYDYRIYHDCFVLENKTMGIYLHKAAA